jgi:hypothetical protein
MDPATATTAVSAGISLYQAGGLALLLIVMGAVGISLMARWFMAMVSALSAELKSVRDEMQRTLVSVIKENTDASRELRHEVAAQTVILSQQNSAMRDRPCLVDQGQKLAPTPLPTLRNP